MRAVGVVLSRNMAPFSLAMMMCWMMLEGHVSLMAMCDAFKWFNGWTDDQRNSIDRQLINECFEEFRHFQYQIRHADDIGDVSTDCPVCCMSKPRIFISLDGNMGLVRKRKFCTPRGNCYLSLVNPYQSSKRVYTHFPPYPIIFKKFFLTTTLCLDPRGIVQHATTSFCNY